jgi:hypothetical protein
VYTHASSPSCTGKDINLSSCLLEVSSGSVSSRIHSKHSALIYVCVCVCRLVSLLRLCTHVDVTVLQATHGQDITFILFNEGKNWVETQGMYLHV